MGYNVVIPGEWHYKLITKVVSITLHLNDFPQFYPIFSAFRDREMHNKELWSRIWAKNAQNDISMKKL